MTDVAGGSPTPEIGDEDIEKLMAEAIASGANETPKEAAEAKKPAQTAKKSSFFLSPKILIPVIALLSIGIGLGVGFALFGGKSSASSPHKEKSHEKSEKEEPSSEEHTKEDEKEKPQEESEKAPAEHGEESKAESGHGEAKPEASGGKLVNLDPAIVNISDRNAIHYLKITIALECETPEGAIELTGKKHELQDDLLFVVGDRSLREILSVAGKTMLKEDLIATFGKRLTKGKVTNIYFTEFAVQ